MSETSAAETFTAIWTDLSCPHCEEALVGFFMGADDRGLLLLEESEEALVSRLNEQLGREEFGVDGIREGAQR